MSEEAITDHSQPKAVFVLVGPEAKEHVATFVQTAEALHRHCLMLYEGTSMPKSESTWTG